MDTDLATEPTDIPTTDSEGTKPEDKTDKTVEQKEWDTKRQEHDQAIAAVTLQAKNARDEADTLATAQQQSQAKIEALEADLAQSKQDAQAKKDELESMDSDTTDKSVINNLQKIEERAARQAEELTALQKKATDYEQRIVRQQTVSDNERAKERVLAPLDEEFGAKFRKAAIKLADDLVDSGKEKAPDPIAVTQLMRKCYVKVSEDAKEKEKKSEVPSDSGGGGISHTTAARKTGRMSEVLADMEKDTSWKKG